MQMHDIGSGANYFRLYGLTANLNYFVEPNLTAAEWDGPTSVQVTRKGSTREQYPGDTSPVSTQGSTAVVLRDPGAENGGRALPGRPVIFEEVTGVNTGYTGAPMPVIGERRQFTLSGSITSLHAWLQTNAKGPMRLITSRGRVYKIKWDEL